MKEINDLVKNLDLKIKEDKLLLPTLPRIAMKVRAACDDYDTTVDYMVSILHQDPALSARMIKYANRAVIKRNSTQNINNLHQVVTRIGLINVKNIATAIAMEQIFISTHKIINEYITKSWNKTIGIACFSTALLKVFLENNPKYKSKLSLDTMMLMGLMHNIGMLPILTEAELKEGDYLKEDVLNYCIDMFSADIGSKIVTEWGFGIEFVNVVQNWSNISIKTDEPSYLDFIRVSLLFNDHLDPKINKKEVYQEFVEKGIIKDLNYLFSNDFRDVVSEVSAAFY